MFKTQPILFFPQIIKKGDRDKCKRDMCSRETIETNQNKSDQFPLNECSSTVDRFRSHRTDVSSDYRVFIFFETSNKVLSVLGEVLHFYMNVLFSLSGFKICRREMRMSSRGETGPGSIFSDNSEIKHKSDHKNVSK